MDIDFRGLINKLVVVYLNDVTIYSKKIHEHIMYLKKKIDCYKKGRDFIKTQ